MIDVKLLLGTTLLKRYTAGTLICSEKDSHMEEMYIILSGKVGKIINFTTPNEKCEGIIEHGGIFGEEGMLCRAARAASYVALEDVTAAAVTRPALAELVKKNGEIAVQLAQTICEARLKAEQKIAELNIEKLKLFDKYKISEADFYKSMLFPQGHKEYNIERPEVYEQFLFKRAYTCPNCQTQFSDFMQLSTKLIPDGQMTCDMRRKYKDFEPLWYDVMTCPHCYFSALEGNFNAKVRLHKEQYEASLCAIHDRVEFHFDSTKTLDNVFASYFLAIICADGYDKKEQIKAKLWLYISWLYADVKDKEMESYAQNIAYEAMHDYLDAVAPPPEAEQANYMILGTLAKKTGRNEDAMLYLNRARRATVSKQVYKQLAEREMDELREMNKQ